MNEETETELPPSKKAKLDDNIQNPQEDVEKTYNNHVTHEELEKLREFQVLDEVKSDDDESNDERSDKSDHSSDEKSEDLPEEEIEKMLEEDLPDTFKGKPKAKDKKYVRRKKIVLEEKGINQFEVLPLDWMMVRHASGMPVYMHRGSRVCTLSKPYFLGKGNTRRHDIPISAIPCLAYRIALKEEQKQMEIDKKIAEQIKNGTWADMSNASKSAESNGMSQNHNLSSETDNIFGSSNQDSPRTENDVVAVAIENIDNSKTQDCAQSDSQDSSKLESQASSSVIHDDSSKSNKNQESITNENQDGSEIEKQNSFKDLDDANNSNSENQSSPQLVNLESSAINNDESSNSENKDAKAMDGDTDNIDKGDFNSQNNDEIVCNSGKLSKETFLSELLAEELGLREEKEQHPFSGENCFSEDVDVQATGKQSKCPYSKADSTISAVLGEGSEAQEMSSSPGARPVVLPGGLVMVPPRVETVSTSWKALQLAPIELNTYCKRLFKFKEVNVMHFKRWADRRKYTKARKTMQYPALPEGTKLITIPAHDRAHENGGKTAKRDWVMNMNGCSYLSVFHEYVRRALHKQPVYEFKQLENATAPYQATVYIGGMQYGVGRGSSKRQAKSQAARASIHILIPEMRDELPAAPADLAHAKDDPDFSFFDYVSIEDPRIQEFCGAAAEPSPHAILRTCLLRNFGATERHIHTEMKKLEFQKIELTMKVGKHSATVVCKNKKQAKQRASQTILQQLHPHITSWGSLLRLYGSRSMKSCKEKKIEEQQITLLQDKARHNEPNHAVLEKLRNEMRKLRERDNAVVPIGTLLVSEDLPTHSGSNLNNVDL